MFDVTVGRALVARKQHECVSCAKIIDIGELYMMFTAFVMQNHAIHFDCYLYDHESKPFLVAIDDKPLWNCEVVRITKDDFESTLQEIRIAKHLPIHLHSTVERK